MQKSMYSLILSDDVVRAVDKLAYSYGTSRSNLINQILAERVSMLTPEKRIETIFATATRAASQQDSLHIRYQPSSSLLEVRSTINYKYNPTIRYSVDIANARGGFSGYFRVMSRSQSEALLDLLNRFFELWNRVEYEMLVEQGVGRIAYEIRPGRYFRKLNIQREEEIPDSEHLGEAIGGYILLFDRAMAHFFLVEQQGGGEWAGEKIRNLYSAYLKGNPYIF